MTEATIDSSKLHLEITGPDEGEPVLLLHGWGSNARLMQPIARALSDVYRVYNVDLPGHGLSPLPRAALSIPEHAALVHDLIRNRIGQPVTIVGHSNGGRIALYMASDAHLSGVIRRLVLVSPSGVKPLRSMKYHLRRAIARTLRTPFEWLPEPLREFGLDWLRHSLVWKLLGSSDYRKLNGVMRETFVQVVNFHLDDRIDRINTPTLLFRGDRDDSISQYQMETLARAIKGAGLVMLENAGHYGYLDQPQPFIRATRHFLEHS